MEHAFRSITKNRHRLYTDGEGVTTLVALSGCPLNCKYCINKDILQSTKIYKVTADAMIQAVMQDYCYFVATGGGVTFGGGEPLLQSEAITEFIRKTKDLFNTNIETSLNVEINTSEILELAHSLIIDIKSIDSNIYKAYTGINNNILLSNLDTIAEKKLQNKCRIKIPSIKGYTTPESIESSIKYIKDLGFKNIDTLDYVVNT